MTKNEQAVLITLVFLGLWGYMMYTFEGSALNLPIVGSFQFEAYSRYVALTGLFIAFVLFLMIRREKQAGEQPTPEYRT